MIDKSKTYRTRDGRQVRIYATDGGGFYPVHGSIFENGRWRINTWGADGVADVVGPTDEDLMEVKPRHKRTTWLNVYNDFEFAWCTKEKADNAIQSRDRIACIKVELDFEEGEGL